MSELDSILKRHPLPTWRGLAWLVMLLLAVAIGWGYAARLEEVAIAEGEVVPQGQIKVIQHLEGGIIESIHVEEGGKVGAGDPLVRLDLAAVGVNREELQVRRDGLILNRARLQAEARAEALAFPEAEAGRRPDLVRSERQTFEAHRREHESVLAVLGQKTRQRQLSIQELGAKREATKTDLGLARQRFDMSGDLLSKGLISRMEHVQLTREVEALQGSLKTIDTQIPRARAALAEARQSAQEARRRFSRQANDELRAVEVEIARIRELLVKATDQVRRTQIVSPIDGVVKNLRYHTIGGVVRPGEPIMEIVPSSGKLVVEARLNPIDRGYVEKDQPVVVKISSYDFVRYGGLDGHVSHIAGDADSTTEGLPYFRVIVETDKSYLGDSEGVLLIIPGMLASVDIHTGRKSVLEYLLKPVLKLKHEAFRER